MKAKDFYNKASENGIVFETTCVDTNSQKLLIGAVKANGKKIKNIIKIHLPELYEDLCLNLKNPYEINSLRTKTHLIYCHSATEYFFFVL